MIFYWRPKSTGLTLTAFSPLWPQIVSLSMSVSRVCLRS